MEDLKISYSTTYPLFLKNPFFKSSPFLCAFFLFLVFSSFILLNDSFSQTLLAGFSYEYKVKDVQDSAYIHYWLPISSWQDTVWGLSVSSKYTAISRVCDKHGFCSGETNDSLPGETILVNPIAKLVSGNGSTDIVVDFERAFPKNTNFAIYSDELCTNDLSTFSSDENAEAKNVGLSSLDPTNINYFWLKADEDNRCRRVNFAYMMTDPCAGLAGGDWVWVPPLSEGIGDGLAVRSSQVGFTDSKGLCVTKYIVSADDNNPTCEQSLSTDASYGGVISSSKEDCSPLSSSSKRPWVMINQTEANDACKRLGTKYGLLTNAERMTIALNAEADYRNWSNQIGFYPGAKLNRGHSESGVGDGDLNYGTRAADEGDCLLRDEFCTLDQVTGWHQNRRTFYVKNGVHGNDVIWDFAGNVFTFGLWSETLAALGVEQLGSSAIADGQWYEWQNDYIDSSEMTKGTSLPQNVLNGNTGIDAASTYNLGRYFKNAVPESGAPMWGGNFEHYNSAGLFSLHLISGSVGFGKLIGFECAFRP